MAQDGRFQVSLFGTSAAFDVWADEVSATWPDRLSFHVHAAGQTARIRTRLVGAHWTPSVLAAIAAALRCGASLEEAANALREVQPVTARMQPVELPGGATMLRDEFNGSLVSAGAALRVLESARAPRKVIVFGCIYDGPGTSRDDVIHVAGKLGVVADVAVIVGSHSEAACRAAIEAGMAPRNVHRVPSLPEVAKVLGRVIRPGDLVLLRGTWDWHLSRVYYALLGDVACWKTDCTKPFTCDHCDELGFRPRQVGQRAPDRRLRPAAETA